MKFINDKCQRKDDIIVVEGNYTLTGNIDVSGAKNSVLKLVAASILAQGKCEIENVPYISDIDIMCKVIKNLGAYYRQENNVLHIDTSTINNIKASYDLVNKMRASISVLGPLISRYGKAIVAMPGGCNIGSRKIDMHIEGLQQMGVDFSVEHGYLIANTHNNLHGASIRLKFASVGATENLLMAAVCAKGQTIIDNAACEPEIFDLCNFLNEMGADIKGAGSRCIIINGVTLDKLHGVKHCTIGDRIEAGTFLVGGALTGGPLVVKGVNPSFLGNSLNKLRLMGIEVESKDDTISVYRDLTKPMKPINLQTLPHPGFPTDLQAQFMLLSCFAHGKSIITENIFENRFMFASEINRMGANVSIDKHFAIIDGPVNLQGAPVSSTDLRAGASLVLAGIMAKGKTMVTHVGHIDRGYEFYCQKLKSLGANVKRIRITDF